VRKIKIEVLERAGWWQVKVCGLRHSRCRSEAAARHGAKRLAVRVQKLRVQARSRAGRMQLEGLLPMKRAFFVALSICSGVSLAYTQTAPTLVSPRPVSAAELDWAFAASALILLAGVVAVVRGRRN